MQDTKIELLRLRTTPLSVTDLDELLEMEVAGGPDRDVEYRSAWGVFVQRPGAEEVAVAIAVRPAVATDERTEVHPLGVAGSRRLAYVVAAVLGITADGVEAEVVLHANQEMTQAMAADLEAGIEELLRDDG